MSTGIKIVAKKAIVEDNDVSDSETGYDIEADEVIAKRNKYTAPLRKLKPLVIAIKKPRANNNKGLKIIVGFMLTCIISPLIVGVSLEFWKEHRATTNQEQPQSIQLKVVPGSDQV